MASNLQQDFLKPKTKPKTKTKPKPKPKPKAAEISLSLDKLSGWFKQHNHIEQELLKLKLKHISAGMVIDESIYKKKYDAGEIRCVEQNSLENILVMEDISGSAKQSAKAWANMSNPDGVKLGTSQTDNFFHGVENVYDFIGTLVKDYQNQFEIPEVDIDHPSFNAELLTKPPKRGPKPTLPKMKEPYINKRYLSEESDDGPVIKKRRVTED
jgi:hypothetical protein